MTPDLQSQNRMSLWLIGLIILLGGIVFIEGGIIISMKRSASGNRQGLLSKILPSRWMPVAGSAQRGASPDSKNDRIVLWESAQDIETIHDQINRLFSTLADPGIPAHLSFPGPSRLQPPAPPSMDHLLQLQHEIDRIFEGAFNDTDIFSLPGRLEQGWNMSGVSSSMHVDDQGSNLVVQMALPGVDASAIAINLQGRLLIVAVSQGADRQTRDAGDGITAGYSRRQRLETKLMLPGPVDADAVQASYRDGVLRIEIPKNANREPLARTIKVI